MTQATEKSQDTSSKPTPETLLQDATTTNFEEEEEDDTSFGRQVLLENAEFLKEADTEHNKPKSNPRQGSTA